MRHLTNQYLICATPEENMIWETIEIQPTYNRRINKLVKSDAEYFFQLGFLFRIPVTWIPSLLTNYLCPSVINTDKVIAKVSTTSKQVIHSKDLLPFYFCTAHSSFPACRSVKCEYLVKFQRVRYYRCENHIYNKIRVSFQFMMTSSNGNIFRVTGHLCGEFTGPRWIPRTKASDAELWCFLWSASE